MKIIETDRNTYFDKINFVDENNVFVGYDLATDCCERADWFMSTTEDTKPIGENDNRIPVDYYDEYVFDKEYFVEVVPAQEGNDDDKYSCLDEGGMVRFKLVSKVPDQPPLFLHIYNSHNGYYSHGFQFGVGDTIIKGGSL
jgi:hypothetical protein